MNKKKSKWDKIKNIILNLITLGLTWILKKIKNHVKK